MNKLKSLVFLIPALIAFGAVGLGLPLTKAVLADIPEKMEWSPEEAKAEIAELEASEAALEEAKERAEQSKEDAAKEDSEEDSAEDESDESSAIVETKALAHEAFSEPAAYKDGTYYGSAYGFGGNIQMCVVISGGKIADISLVSAPGETPSFLNKAMAVISRMKSAGSPNVDTVSGATYSSNGMINAVKRALSSAAADGNTSELEVSELPQESSEEESMPTEPIIAEPTVVNEDAYKDGFYEASGWCVEEDDLFRYGLKVNLSIEGGKITNLTVTKMQDLSDDPEDNDPFIGYAVNGRVRGGKAYPGVPAQILANQTTAGVDVVSSATYSSKTILSLAEKILKAAKDGATEAITEPEPSSEESSNRQEESSAPESESSESSAAESSSSDSLAESSSSEESSDSESSDSDSSADESSESSEPEEPKVYEAAGWCIDDDEEFEYELKLKITFVADKITEVAVGRGEDKSDNPSANDKYIKRAVDGYKTRVGLKNQLLEKQSAEDLDVVSSATYSSKTIIQLAKDIMKMRAAE